MYLQYSPSWLERRSGRIYVRKRGVKRVGFGTSSNSLNRQVTHPVVVESPAGESELLRLKDQRVYDFRVAVSLIDRAIRAQEVEVLLPVNVPNLGVQPLRQHDGEGVVVVSAMAVLEIDALGGAQAKRAGGKDEEATRRAKKGGGLNQSTGSLGSGHHVLSFCGL